MLHIGIPAVITNAIIPVSNGIVVAMIATFGLNAVAGFGIAMRIESIFQVPFYALSAVSSPFFGQNSGDENKGRLVEARWVISRFCLIFGLILAFLLFVFSGPLTGMFSDSEVIQAVAINYLWIVPVSYGAYGLVMSANASFNGMGKPLPGVAISAMRVIVVFLPLAFLGKYLFGIPGLFAASTIANLALGLLAYFWLGKYIRLVKD